MDKIGTLITRQSQKSSAQTTRPDSARQESGATVTAEHIRRLWAAMARLYGHRWTSSMSVEDDGTWLAVLRKFTEQNIRAALMACAYQNSSRDADDGWPPTLPQFVALCKPKQDPAHKRYRALPRAPVDKGEIESNIKKLREAINVRSR